MSIPLADGAALKRAGVTGGFASSIRRVERRDDFPQPRLPDARLPDEQPEDTWAHR